MNRFTHLISSHPNPNPNPPRCAIHYISGSTCLYGPHLPIISSSSFFIFFFFLFLVISCFLSIIFFAAGCDSGLNIASGKKQFGPFLYFLPILYYYRLLR